MIETKFKETEVGRVPADWEVKTISQMSDIITGATPSTSNPQYWDNGQILWMSSGELNNKFIHNVQGRITQIGYDHTGTHMLPKHCVLIGLAGQGKTRGTAAYNKVELCTNQSIAAILPNENTFNSLYLYYYTDSQYEQLRQLSAGDGGRGGLNKQILLNLYVSLPPLPEQRRIATALSDIDSLISSLDELIEKKRNIKQGTMQQLLTGKTRLKGFSEPWVEKKLGDICYEIFSGKNSMRSESGKYPVYGSTGILGFSDVYLYDYQTILVARVGANAGLVNKVSGKYDVSDNTLIIHLQHDQHINLLLYILRYRKLNLLVFGSGQPLITGSQLKSLLIKLPASLSEQRAIASILTSMDDEIAALEQKREKYVSLKQGMMQELLTGRIRLV